MTTEQELEDRLIIAIIGGFGADPSLIETPTKAIVNTAYAWVDEVMAQRMRRKNLRD